jgi:hypothetical protein
MKETSAYRRPLRTKYKKNRNHNSSTPRKKRQWDDVFVAQNSANFFVSLSTGCASVETLSTR